jgi:hypothetical protein
VIVAGLLVAGFAFPFLLVLLGDRYGWVPPEDRIEAAAREQGFQTSPAGKSVTALEIEFGILKEYPEQKRRSLFFFRKPLPYEAMPGGTRATYSDAYSPEARDGVEKLNALNHQVVEELFHCFQALQADEAVRVVI